MAFAFFKSSTTQTSFEGSWKLSAAPFESSSDSSGSSSGSGQAAYHRDVRDYAARFPTTPSDVSVFQHDLSTISEGHGVTDWEYDVTYVAIGQGLARGGLDDGSFRRLSKQLASSRDLALVKAG